MVSKGSKTCCCDGCYGRPFDRSLTSEAVQPAEAYCCSCIPKEICVTVTNDATQETVTKPFFCRAIFSDPIVYSGTIAISGFELELEIRLVVENGICYLCLDVVGSGSGSGLVDVGTGVGDDHCHVIDSSKRAAPESFCTNFAASWDVGGLTISIAAADNVPIEGRKPCVDGSGNVVPDEEPIRNICGGCGCICECACIVIFGDLIPAYVEVGCLNMASGSGSAPCAGTGGGTGTAGDEYPVKYCTPSGIQIALVANSETGCCELKLVSSGPYELIPESLINNTVSIGQLGNECPSPEAFFSAFTVDGDAIFFYFLCGGCGCPTFSGDACCDGNLPLVVTAEITASTGCECGSIILPLVHGEFGWEGELTEGFCGHPVKLNLACSGDEWTLQFTGSPCTPQSAVGTGTCSPLNLTFTLTTGGIGCCGGASLINPTLTIVITE